tara:strand:+ start:831 stop:1061 length:231 start_codon:yes stop_codon:yes gene_type:complete
MNNNNIFDKAILTQIVTDDYVYCDLSIREPFTDNTKLMMVHSRVALRMGKDNLLQLITSEVKNLYAEAFDIVYNKK